MRSSTVQHTCFDCYPSWLGWTLKWWIGSREHGRWGKLTICTYWRTALTYWRSNGQFFAAGLVWVQAPSGHAKAMFCQQGGSLNSSLNKPCDNTKPNKRRSPRSQRSLNSGLMCSKLGASQSLTRLQWTRLQIANSACCFSLIFGKLRTTIKIHFTLARPALASSNSTWLQVVEKTFWKQKYWRRATCFLTCFLQFCNWNSYETPCPKNPSTFQNCKHSKLGSVRLHQWLSA